MSTPESTADTSNVDTAASAKQTVGQRLALPSSNGKAPWWKRLLGRS
jgi:hypothetical protein